MLGHVLFEFLPAFIGVCAYVLYKLLLISPLPNESPKKEEAIPVVSEECSEPASEPSSPRSVSSVEPDQEPQTEEVTETARLHTAARWPFLALATTAVLVLSVFGLPQFDRQLSPPLTETSTLNVSGPMGVDHVLPHCTTVDLASKCCSVEGMVGATSTDDKERSEQVSEEATDVAFAMRRDSAVQDSHMDGESALTIKLTRQKVTTNEQEDFVRSAYYGTLMIGTPPEPFTVVFDTGSGHLILPSAYCKSETCKMHNRYRRSASTTGKDINEDGNVVLPGQRRHGITVSFGTGTVTGVFVEDTVCVETLSDQHQQEIVSREVADADDAVLPMGCVELRMIAATQLSEDPFKDFQFDGILGLGLDGLSHTPEFNFLNVVAQSVQAWGGRYPQTFAVFLAESVGESSEIALGGWSRERLREDLSWNPVHNPEMGHWIVNIKSIRANGELLNFCSDGQCKGAVDTGTSLISVPTAVFPELYNGLRHPTPLSGHCQGQGPLLHIELDSFTITLGPRDYASAEKTNLNRPKQRLPKVVSSLPTTAAPQPATRRDLRCNPSFMTLDMPEPLGPKLFILGEPVLRKYYTAYDARSKRIGFARAKHPHGPGRADLMVIAADEGIGARAPNMFDVFRWRKTYR